MEETLRINKRPIDDTSDEDPDCQVLRELGIDRASHSFSKLFACDIDAESGICTERFLFISTLYAKWVAMRMSTSRKEVPDILDIIDNELSAEYDFVQFLNDFRWVIADASFSPTKCALEGPDGSCFVLSRHERIKEEFSVDSARNAAVFFVSGLDAETATKSISTQQCLDSAHIFSAHRIKLNVQPIEDAIKVK